MIRPRHLAWPRRPLRLCPVGHVWWTPTASVWRFGKVPGRSGKRRLRVKIPALIEASTGRFTEHHAFLARVHLDLIDQHTAAIDDITTPYRGDDGALSRGFAI